MKVVLELEHRIQSFRALLALEIEHHQRVVAAGLDAEDAQRVIDRRCRNIESLESHHDRVLAHRLALQKRTIPDEHSAHSNLPLCPPLCAEDIDQ